MEDGVRVVHQLGEERRVEHRADDVAEVGMCAEMIDVPDGPGGEVVDHPHRVPTLEKLVGQV